jgi:hypothetical protein
VAQILLGNIKGEPGKNAKITEVSATVSNTIGTPSVEVTMGGDEQNRSFHFAFSGLKGEQGDSVAPVAYADEGARTHYAEEIFVCGFTIDESWTEESETINLQNTIDLATLKVYVDGKSVNVEYEENSEGAFSVQLLDTETNEKLARLSYSPTKWTGEPEPHIRLAFSKETVVSVEVYEENVVTLDEKYLPKSVPKWLFMIILYSVNTLTILLILRVILALQFR